MKREVWSPESGVWSLESRVPSQIPEGRVRIRFFCTPHSAFHIPHSKGGVAVAEVLVRAAGLGKRYGGDENAICVLENLDLEIHRAERVAIVGESGVGKSTLLHILGTLD